MIGGYVYLAAVGCAVCHFLFGALLVSVVYWLIQTTCYHISQGWWTGRYFIVALVLALPFGLASHYLLDWLQPYV